MVAKGTNILTSKLPTDSLRTIEPSYGSLTPQFSRSIKPQFFAKEPSWPFLLKVTCFKSYKKFFKIFLKFQFYDLNVLTFR